MFGEYSLLTGAPLQRNRNRPRTDSILFEVTRAALLPALEHNPER